MADVQGATREELALYQDLVDTKLRPHLAGAIRRKEALLGEINDYQELAGNIDLLQRQHAAAGHTELKTMVDVGSDCFVQAKVEDSSRLFVHVAMGFQLEMTLDEALAFTGVKDAHLKRWVSARGLGRRGCGLVEWLCVESRAWHGWLRPATVAVMYDM
jgi:hypothetical protein